MSLLHPERYIVALPADELEKFAREWALLKKGYFEVQKFSGAYDMGRDVVGYLTKERHEGDWHNYQCKQYGKAVPLGTGLCEIGKVLYFAHEGEFTAPTKFFFVAAHSDDRDQSFQRIATSVTWVRDGAVGCCF